MNMLRRTERGNPRGALPGWMKRIGMASDDLTGKGQASRKVARGENLDNLTESRRKTGQDTDIAAIWKAHRQCGMSTNHADSVQSLTVFDCWHSAFCNRFLICCRIKAACTFSVKSVQSALGLRAPSGREDT